MVWLIALVSEEEMQDVESKGYEVEEIERKKYGEFFECQCTELEEKKFAHYVRVWIDCGVLDLLE